MIHAIMSHMATVLTSCTKIGIDNLLKLYIEAMTSNQVKVTQHLNCFPAGKESPQMFECRVLQTHRQAVTTSLVKLLHGQGIFFCVPPLTIYTA